MIKITSPREIIIAVSEEIKKNATDEQKTIVEEYKKMLLEFF